MAVYFISDVHLGLGSREGEKAKEDRLLGFFKATRPSTEALYIIGDLFDFWFEYTTVIPKGFHRTLAALQEYTDSGIPIHYLAGNHDFWMGDFFRNELGMKLYFDPFEVAVGTKRIYLHHGDGLARKDLGYRLIKPILRNRIGIRLYRWLHPDIGVPLARGSSRSSREYTSNRNYGEDEGMIRIANQKISDGVDIVIMGHRHRPDLRRLGNGIYINLGDWITYNTYAELLDDVMTLKMWEGSQGSGQQREFKEYR